VENLEIHVQNDILVIKVNLTRSIRLSSSGRSVLIGSSGGNLRLIDKNGYREERINLSVTKPVPKTASDNDVLCQDKTDMTGTTETESADESDNAQ